MRVEGKCHCGNIQYEADVDPDRVSICHCTDCQTLTGTAYRVSVPAPRESFALLAGEPTIYVKIAQSGARRAQVFCANCGSPLYTYDVDQPERLGLRVGSIKQRRELVPMRQIWCRSALPWSMDISSLPRRDQD